MTKKSGPHMTGDVVLTGFVVKYTLTDFKEHNGEYYFTGSGTNWQEDSYITLNRDINCSTLFNTEDGADTETNSWFLDVLHLKQDVFDEGVYIDIGSMTDLDGIKGVKKEVFKVSRTVKTIMGDIYEQR